MDILRFFSFDSLDYRARSCSLLLVLNFLGLVTPKVDTEVATFANMARVQFPVFMRAVSCKLHSSLLVVAVLAQAARVVLLICVLTLRHLLLNLARSVLFCALLYRRAFVLSLSSDGGLLYTIDLVLFTTHILVYQLLLDHAPFSR